MDYVYIGKIVILVVILGVLGFNIFTYLAKGTDLIGTFLKNIGGDFEKSANDLLGRSPKKKAPPKKKATPKSPPVKPFPKNNRPSTLSSAVNKGAPKPSPPSVSPDSTTKSTIQRTPQKGFCYIGTDRGFRSCIRVHNEDQCMSGQIFPTRNICINPKLRQ